MLTRWGHFGFGDVDRTLAAFDELRREMDRVLWDMGRQGLPTTHSLIAGGGWPAVDLAETENDLVVTAELPGFRMEDIHITLNQSVLTLHATRLDEVPDGYNVLRKERGAIDFTRSFSLPCKADPERAKAELKDGLLILKIAKAEEMKARQIPVSTR